MDSDSKKLPPPWFLVLLGGLFLYWSWEHYVKMDEFERGLRQRIFINQWIGLVYKFFGFWPTVVLPFIPSSALVIGGVCLTVRDIRRRARGESVSDEYETVRWGKVLLGTVLAIVGFTALIALVLQFRE